MDQMDFGVFQTDGWSAAKDAWKEEEMLHLEQARKPQSYAISSILMTQMGYPGIAPPQPKFVPRDLRNTIGKI